MLNFEKVNEQSCQKRILIALPYQKLQRIPKLNAIATTKIVSVLSSGSPKDGGILPRALDVIFNSIEGKQWDNMSLKPRLFCEVGKLGPEQEAEEHKVKENILKLATDEVPVSGGVLYSKATPN